MEGILIKNIQNTDVIPEPYEHRQFKMFDNELCNRLIDNFISIKKYMTKSKGISQSRVMICLPGNTQDGIDFSNHEYLKSIEPLNSILNDYLITILPILNKTYDYDSTPKFRFQINLVYDTKNYTIGPHTDSYLRKVTSVVYLVSDKDQDKKLGLSLYKDLINRHKYNWEKTHYSFDNFEQVCQVDYYNGASVDLHVSKNSFHGVNNINTDCDRMSIQSIIWK